MKIRIRKLMAIAVGGALIGAALAQFAGVI